MASPAPENANNLFGFEPIHTSGNDQIRALGTLSADKCRWWTLALRPRAGVDDNEAVTSITVATVKTALAPKARNNQGFSILNDTETAIILVVFHAKHSLEKAKFIIANNPHPPFLCFDIMPLADLDQEERENIDFRLGNYLKAVQRGVQGAPLEQATVALDNSDLLSPATNLENATIDVSTVSPGPADAGAGPSSNHSPAGHEPTPSQRRSRSIRKFVRKGVHPSEDDKSLRHKNWRDANLHLRDIVNNVTLVHRDLRELPAIQTVLDQFWEPSTKKVDSALEEAIERLVEDLPDPSEDRNAPVRLQTAISQAAALCGIELSLEIIDIDDSSEGEQPAVKVSDRKS